MNRARWAYVGAWSVWALAVTAALGGFAFSLVNRAERVSLAAIVVGVATIGTLGAQVVTRRPAIRAGWMLLAFAVSAAVGSFCYVVAWHYGEDSATWPARLLAGTALGLWSIPYASLLLLALTAPEGRLLSPRWRIASAGIAACVALWLFVSVYAPLKIDDVRLFLTDNGLAGGSGKTDVLAETLWLASIAIMGAVFVAAAASLLLRYRRSGGERRQQVKWVVLGLSVALALQAAEVVEVSAEPWSVAQDLIPMFAFVSLSAGFGFSLFRKGLWEIDWVVQRSLVYGLFWLSIAALYVGISLTLGLAASSRVPVWSAVAVTAVATLLFQPARHWMEKAANRLVFGPRHQPLEVVQVFGEALGSAEQPRAIAAQLAKSTIAAAPLAWVKVEAAGPVAVELGRRREGPPVQFALSYARERLGELSCQPLPGSTIGDDERSLLSAMAAQAALAMSRAQLASRIVRAQEAERRRIERNIHDGAQQELVALVAKLGLARNQNGSANNAALLTELQDEVRAILANLRELAQGVHPSVLEDGGLAAAVEDRCSRLTIPVALDILPGLRARRFEKDIEAAAYYAVAEGLTNVLRHSGAKSARVSLGLNESLLSVVVADDGAGFDVQTIPGNGGLQGLADRCEALGGQLTVELAPGSGTRLLAKLPVSGVTSA